MDDSHGGLGLPVLGNGGHVHHQQFLFAPPEEEDEESVHPSHQQHKVESGYHQYLEIGMSHSEPPRFGVVMNRSGTPGNDFSLPDDRIFMDGYKTTGLFSGAPNSAITQITNDMHHHH